MALSSEAQDIAAACQRRRLSWRAPARVACEEASSANTVSILRVTFAKTSDSARPVDVRGGVDRGIPLDRFVGISHHVVISLIASLALGAEV